MLRDLIINDAKASNSMYKAKVNMITGMAVVKDVDSINLVDTTTEECVTDIYFVNKDRVPSGLNTARGDISDYDVDFVNVKANEFIKLEKYLAGERFATDQFDSTTITTETKLNTRVSFKDGKVQKSTIPSHYEFKGFMNDNGHTLVIIEVSDTLTSNVE